MLNKKIRYMLLALGVMANPISAQLINQVEVHSATTISDTGVITETGVANITTTTTTKYSDYFTVPEGVDNPTLNYSITYSVKQSGDGAYLYLYEYDLNGNFIGSRTLIASHINYNPGRETNQTFSNMNAFLNAGYKYRLYLKHDSKSSNGTWVSSTRLTYTQTPENLITIINDYINDIETQEDVDNVQELIDTTQSIIDNISDEERKTSLQDDLDLSQKALNIEQARLYVEKAENTYLETDLEVARRHVNELHDCQEKIDLQERLDTLQRIIDENKVKIQLAIEAIIVAENTQAQSDIDYAQSLINELLNTPEKTELQNRLNVVPAIKAVEIAETTYNQTDYNTAKNLVNALPNSTIKTSLNDRLNEVQNVISAISYVERAEDIKTKDSLINARTKVNELKDSDIKTSLHRRLDALQSVIAIDDDKVAPNEPVISVNDNMVTISAEDIGETEIMDMDITDTFEESGYQNELTGNWERTSSQKHSGSYSLGSTNKSNSSSSSMVVKFKVLPETTGLLSFNHLVKSEAKYDLLIITLNGTQIVNSSGNGSWTAYSKTLSPGEYTLEFKYQKDSSTSSYDDRAYIDNLRIKGQKVITNLPSGIKKIEYQLNNGEWNEYTEAFTPSISGEVIINARAIDYANNISPIATKTIYIEDLQMNKVIENIEKLEVLIRDLSNYEKLNNATNLYDETMELMSEILESNDKEVLSNRLININNVIEEAELVLKAKDSVEILEELSEDLSSQILIDNINIKLNESLALTNAIQEGEVKTDLLNRINEVQLKINISNAIIKVIIAEDNLTQVDLDDALEVVKLLPDSEEDKTSLLNRLEEVQRKIDIREAEAKYKIQLQEAIESVILAETTISQIDVDNATSLVAKLRPEDKAPLIERLEEVQRRIDIREVEAQYKLQLEEATNMVILAETTINQEDVDNAIPLVSKLKEEDKAPLMDRLTEVQNKINLRKIENKYKLQLEKAIESVVLAETTITQTDVDSATSLVIKLRPEDKAPLLDRLSTVQKIIDVTISVENVELKSRDLSAQKKIDAINQDISKVTLMINSISKKVIKNNLTERIDNVINKVDEAQVNMHVNNAEIYVKNKYIEIAKSSATKIRNTSLKTDYKERIKAVEDIIIEHDNSEMLYNELEEILINSKSIDLHDIKSKEAVEKYNASLEEVNKKAQSILNRLNNLPVGKTPAMETKKQEAINTIIKITEITPTIKKSLIIKEESNDSNENTDLNKNIEDKVEVITEKNQDKDLTSPAEIIQNDAPITQKDTPVDTIEVISTEEGVIEKDSSVDKGEITSTEDEIINEKKEDLEKVIEYSNFSYYELSFVIIYLLIFILGIAYIIKRKNK